MGYRVGYRLWDIPRNCRFCWQEGHCRHAGRAGFILAALCRVRGGDAEMNTPRENVAEINRLIQEIQAHPMCLRWRHESGVYLVIYPEGYWPQGVQAAYGGQVGKIEALRRILDKMEQHWRLDLAGVNLPG